MLFLLLACATAPAPPAGPDVQAALVAADLGALQVRRAVVVEVGAVHDGAWAVQDAGGIALPAELDLAWGRAVVRVERPCGPAWVPVRVGAAAQVVVPVAACEPPDAPALADGVQLDRHERSWAELVVLAELGVVEGVAAPPVGEEATPARFVDHATAAAVCAFWGGRLPTVAEWRAAGGGGADHRADAVAAPGDPGWTLPAGPRGHTALDGNVAEWLSAPAGASAAEVAGGSWLRHEALGERPVQAREGDLGFRCAFGAGRAPDPAPLRDGRGAAPGAAAGPSER